MQIIAIVTIVMSVSGQPVTKIAEKTVSTPIVQSVPECESLYDSSTIKMIKREVELQSYSVKGVVHSIKVKCEAR